MKISVQSKIITTNVDRKIHINLKVTSIGKVSKQLILKDDKAVLVVKNLRTNKTIRINIPY